SYNPETETMEQVLERDDIHTTSLTAFFDACHLYPELASNLLYADFPTRFTWHADEKIWSSRKSGFSIGRVYFCPPSAGERYYLRMLLYNIPGPTSYIYLKTYQGI